MKRCPNEILGSSKRSKNVDDDYLFQGNDGDEEVIANLEEIEPLQQMLSIPNPPMKVDDDEFGDDALDDAAYEELQVVETEFLRQTQMLQGSLNNSGSSSENPSISQKYMCDQLKCDLERLKRENQALMREKLDLQSLIYAKTGEISMIRRGFSNLQSENAELKSSFLSQSLVLESQKKKIEHNYRNQLESYQARLIFQDQELKNAFKNQNSKSVKKDHKSSELQEIQKFEKFGSFPVEQKLTNKLPYVGVSTGLYSDLGLWMSKADVGFRKLLIFLVWRKLFDRFGLNWSQIVLKEFKGDESMHNLNLFLLEYKTSRDFWLLCSDIFILLPCFLKEKSAVGISIIYILLETVIGDADTVPFEASRWSSLWLQLKETSIYLISNYSSKNTWVSKSLIKDVLSLLHTISSFAIRSGKTSFAKLDFYLTLETTLVFFDATDPDIALLNIKILMNLTLDEDSFQNYANNSDDLHKLIDRVTKLLGESSDRLLHLECISLLSLLAHECENAILFLKNNMETLILLFHQLMQNIFDDPIVQKIVRKTLRILLVIFLEGHITIHSNSPKSLHSLFLASLTRFWCFSKETNECKELTDCVSDLLCFIISDPEKYLQQIDEMICE